MADNKTTTHVAVSADVKVKLEELRDRIGAASMSVVIDKLVKKCGSKLD